MHRELLHTGLIAQDASLGAFTAGVNGQNGQFAAFLLQYMYAKLVDAGALAGTWHTADAHSHTVARIRQTLLYHLLGYSLMLGHSALNQCDSLSQYRHISLQDTFHIIGCGQLAPCEPSFLEIRIDNRHRANAFVDGQSGKL